MGSEHRENADCHSCSVWIVAAPFETAQIISLRNFGDAAKDGQMPRRGKIRLAAMKLFQFFLAAPRFSVCFNVIGERAVGTLSSLL